MTWMRYLTLGFALLFIFLAAISEMASLFADIEVAEILVDRKGIRVWQLPGYSLDMSYSIGPPKQERDLGWPSFEFKKSRSGNWAVEFCLPHWFTNLISWSLLFILWRKSRRQPKRLLPNLRV